MSYNFDNRAEVYHRIREMTKDQRKDFIDRLCDEIAFSTQTKGGVGFDFIMGWCIIKLDPFNNNSLPDIHGSKEEAITLLNEYNASVGIPPYEDLPVEMQDVLCFPAPFRLIPIGKTSKSTLDNLIPNELKRQVAAEIRSKVEEGINLLISEKYTTPLHNHPSIDSLTIAYQHSLDEQLSDFANEVESNIDVWETLTPNKKSKLKAPTAMKGGKWVDTQTDLKSFFLNSIRKVLLDNEVYSIAEVLAYSHPILEAEYVIEKKRGKPRKPVNTNDVHGVYINSNVKEIIGIMAKKGFDNQPVYCRKKAQCIGTIRLKEALSNLFLGKYEDHETFEDYEDMIRNGLLLHPPPVFLPSDPVDYLVSLFNAGCEAILFNFNRTSWDRFNPNSSISEVLEDGWHIVTPHDVVIFMLEHY